MKAVEHRMSAYFHQDWDVDGGTTSDSVARFLRESSGLTTACADEIDELLGRELAEGELERQLVAWGCDYRAGDSDSDYRMWLVEVRDQIRASTP